MEYTKAVEAAKILKEIELNEADINILEEGIQDGIFKAQIAFVSYGPKTYSTTVYQNNRLNLLVRVLKEENEELRKRLSEL